MTDTNSTPIGLGIDFRAAGIAGALSDGREAELLAGPTGEPRSPPELHATEDGVRARPPGLEPEPNRRIPVLPRYGDGRPEYLSGDTARFELEVESLFADLVDGWRESAPTAASALETELPGEGLPPNAVVSVPGVYDREDRDAVSRALEAAGIDVGAVVRAPVAVAAAEFPAISEPQLLVVVDVGSHWFDAALVRVDPDEATYRVVSRVGEAGVGRDAMDKALAEWAIERTAREENRRVTYDERSIEHLREAADDALATVTNDADGSISAEEVPGLTSDDGRTLGVDVNVDMSDTYEAIEPVEKAVIGRLRDLFDATDVGRSDVDKVVVAGPGVDPVPIANALSGFLDRPLSEPRLGGRETASVRGAAILANQFREAGQSPVRLDTLDRDVGVLVPTDEGETFETVVPGSVPVGTSREVTLKTTRDDQTRGSVTVASRHRGSGEVTAEGSYEIAGIPPRQAGEGRVTLSVTARSEAAGGVEVSPSLPADGDATLSLDPPTETAPRLTCLEADPSDLDTSVADDATLATRAETDGDPIEDLSPRSILGRIMSVRYNLWHTAQADATLDPSDVENLLKEFTAGMRRLGVEPIAPEPGDDKDLEEHTVWDTRRSEQPDDTVLEVRKPGFRIGDFVEQTADVTISKGEPETTDERSAEDSESAATEGEEPTDEDGETSADDGEPTDEDGETSADDGEPTDEDGETSADDAPETATEDAETTGDEPRESAADSASTDERPRGATATERRSVDDPAAEGDHPDSGTRDDRR
ncbi:nucleotide exchange factor GrpE [Halorubrum sp. Atlit-26R]|uniref:nucleotide exchange factor GrpE n=1 Tax=Halorubrum sp. Atlit-26R TaxID=2282128 RepID=UPI000EF1D2E4|nr:Hsp70 family protein [Halorubrum sp. Atlit-26R]RLM72981.1 nucleotide exchange factor GrpE [Halorubrum sp. Atlit-26R]